MDDVFIKEVKDLEVLKGQDLTKSAESVKKELPKYLDADEIRRVITGMSASKDKVLLTFLWMSGDG